MRLPDLTAPLATYLGWNLRDADIGAPGQLMNLTGWTTPLPQRRRPAKRQAIRVCRSRNSPHQTD
jgi:hypothetical protein